MTTTAKKTTTKKDPLELPLKPFAFEVLHLASKQRSKAKKVEVLKRYEDPSLKALFIWNFDETIVSVLPPGEVPYTGYDCLLYTSPSPRDTALSRMPSSA